MQKQDVDKDAEEAQQCDHVRGEPLWQQLDGAIPLNICEQGALGYQEFDGDSLRSGEGYSWK